MNPLYRNDRPGILPDSWYVASTDIPPERPPLKGAVATDVCVIGAGYTGLSAARHLAAKGLDVIVLDAHRVGFGASGRNGGQVCSGYDKDQSTLIKHVGRDHAKALWQLAEEAKADLRNLCAQIPEARYTAGLVHGTVTAKEAAHDAAEVELLAREYGYADARMCDTEEMRALVKSPRYHSGLLDMGAGHIHPLRYALGLARLAEAAGARIYERSEVHQITKGDPAIIATNKARIKARHVILAGNGYLPNLERKVAARVMPLNSFISATEPLGDRAAEIMGQDLAVNDSQFVVNYFRLSEDGRLLFGGRPSYRIGFPQDIATVMHERIAAVFPQFRGVKIDYAWGGTLGVTIPRLPAVVRVAPNIVSAGGYSGHGVALSGLAGKVMAEAVAGQAGRFDTLAGINVPPFPGGTAFRTPLLALAMTWYSMRDRLGV
ncbi:NAD(P)/FAD-dependent oxidoreductase [Yoonia sp. R78084]|uniref:NAD(P)/FAD-dependent oxidoreductase n=1 Tax=Yoonia sp. R78084 TaxID=3093869 RepID=UPI0037DD0C29